MNKQVNVFKYKNKTTFLGKLRKRIVRALDIRFPDIVVAKHGINLYTYKYLHRNLVKLNKSLLGIATISLNKSKYAHDYGYTLVISLKVRR